MLKEIMVAALVVYVICFGGWNIGPILVDLALQLVDLAMLLVQ